MKKIFSFLILVFLLFAINISFTQAQLVDSSSEMYDLTKEAADAANLGDVNIGTLVARGIQTILSFLAIIFLVLTLLAGFKWMTAQGNEEQIKKASASIKAAIIGLIIVLAAYTITWFIFKVLPFGFDSSSGSTITSP